MSEARCTSAIEQSEVDVKGYSCLRCDSTTRHTGGILMYIREDIKFNHMKRYVYELNYWCVVVNVTLGGNRWLVGGMYHSPNASHVTFLEKLEEWCDDYFGISNRCIFVGDVNINYLDQNNFYTRKVKELIMRYGISQVINEYTRCTNISSTLIDYVLTNNEGLCVNIHNVPKITDHAIISINLNNGANLKVNNNFMYRKLNDDVFHNINLELISQAWNLDSTDVNVVYRDIVDKCSVVLNNLAPVIVANNKGNQVPWYNTEIKNKSLERDTAYKNYKKSNNAAEKDILWNIYKAKRNEVVNLHKNKKREYFENKIDKNKNDPKEMWKVIKTIIKGDENTLNFRNIKFYDNNNIKYISNEIEAANEFNKFFVSSIVDISNSIKNTSSWSPTQYDIVNNSLTDFKMLTMSDLRQKIFVLKERNNVNDILTSKFIKNTIDTLGFVLLNFINTSLQYGNFPTELKVSTIVPIPKIQNATEMSDYRPINTLPDIEKLLELSVYDQVVDYFQMNNLFIGNQSGFRKKHSCETAVQLSISKWKQIIDEGNFIVAVFIDFKRAFETIDREILINKLKYYGINGTVLKWFQQYILDRQQVTKIGNSISNALNNSIGVPQGSILGPLLFIVYLNDINHIDGCDFVNLFADDTLVACWGNDINVIVNRMNSVLVKLEKFLNVNKLKLNVMKTKGMILGTKYKLKNINVTDFQLKIENENIEWVTEIKYLGIIIDECLDLKAHYEYIYKKISTKLYFFTRISTDISFFARRTIYQTIIQPHFDYCATLLYLFDKNRMQSLQKLQNRGLRIILKCNRFSAIRTMHDSLNYLYVENRLYLLTMIFVFKIKSNMMPSYFDEFIVYNDTIHDYNTRNNENFHINRTMNRQAMNSIFFKGLNEFNKLPALVKNSSSVCVFKKHLIKMIRDMRVI